MSKTKNVELIAKIKVRIREKAADDNEIADLISTCKKEMEMAGVYGDESDPTYYQAIVLYCKGNYGYDEDTERFQRAFCALRDSMNLSGNYEKEEGNTNA